MAGTIASRLDNFSLLCSSADIPHPPHSCNPSQYRPDQARELANLRRIATGFAADICAPLRRIGVAAHPGQKVWLEGVRHERKMPSLSHPTKGCSKSGVETSRGKYLHRSLSYGETHATTNWVNRTGHVRRSSDGVGRSVSSRQSGRRSRRVSRWSEVEHTAGAPLVLPPRSRHGAQMLVSRCPRAQDSSGGPAGNATSAARRQAGAATAATPP